MFTLAATGISFFNADELDREDRRRLTEQLCLYPPGNHTIDSLAIDIKFRLGWSTSILGTCLMVFVVIYISLSGISEKGTVQMKKWWIWARYFLLSSMLFMIFGISNFFFFLASLENIKFPIIPIEQNCPGVFLTMKVANLHAYEYKPSFESARIILSWSLLPILVFLAVYFPGKAIRSIRNVQRLKHQRAIQAGFGVINTTVVKSFPKKCFW